MDFTKLGQSLGTVPQTTMPTNAETGLIVDYITIDGGAVPIVRDSEGNIVGKIKRQAYELRMKQLRPATKGVARSNYHPDRDAKFADFLADVKRKGDLIDPLVVVPTRDFVDIEGKPFQVYDVHLGIRGWWALYRSEKPMALCEIRPPTEIGTMLMDAISKDRNHISYTLRDRCEIATYLVKELGLNQAAVGKAYHCSQATISLLIGAVKDQHPVLLEMMGTDSLSLDHVTTLNKRFPVDMENRVLCARWAVQEELSKPAMEDVINEMIPLEGFAGPITYLHLANPDDERSIVVRDRIDPELPPPVQGANPDDAPTSIGRQEREPVQFYLFRRTTLAASTSQAVQHAKQLNFSFNVYPDRASTIDHPDRTAVFDLFKRWERGDIEEITVEMWEEAYLADLQRGNVVAASAGLVEVNREPRVIRESVVDVTDQAAG